MPLALRSWVFDTVRWSAKRLTSRATWLFDQDRPPASEGGPCKYKTRQKPTNQGSYREDTSMRAATVRLTLDWAAASQERGRRSVLLRRAAGMHFRCWRENPGTRCEPVWPLGCCVCRRASVPSGRKRRGLQDDNERCQRDIRNSQPGLAYKECCRERQGEGRDRCDSYLFVNASIRDFPATHGDGECSK